VTARGGLIVAALVVAALVLQVAILARLPLPGAAPDLVLVVVAAVALAVGARSGAVTGFAAGLLVDLQTDTAVGRVALAYVVVGFLAGLAGDRGDRSLGASTVLVAGLSAVAVLVYGLEGALLGDARVTGASIGRSLASTVPYCGALAAVVVPPVGALLRRADRRR
jgi:rod shape-determining protein MreD